ncbi:MAG TPA: histidinol dehydrogenase [Fimbriimonadaceae bacterium]|jgi:histidinol dehydrogenase
MGVPLCKIYTDSAEAFRFLATRGVAIDEKVGAVVAQIIEDVRTRGDAAVLESAQKFDSPKVSSVLATEEEMEQAAVPERDLAAIRTAIKRVRFFHDSQMKALTAGWDASDGLYEWQQQESHGGTTGQRLRPLSKAGIYVPGGKANYPSSVIMNCVPALAAGVKDITITSPAGENGSFSPAVLVAARECGIERLAKVGGAAAIAALAFGTESIPRVDKIAGPGNKFVNEAKRQLWGRVGLDLYAGPSEVCVLVDDSANAKFAAIDWLTQVEHAEDNAGFLVSTSESKLLEVLLAAELHLQTAPRAAIIRAALANYGTAFVAKDIDEALELVNAIAPEHLTVSVREPEKLLGRIENAGCTLLGEFTPESAGDYAIGPSHTLPTSTAARFASPLNVLDFVKVQSVSFLTKADLEEITPAIEAFGTMEGLPTHGYGATVRRL